MEKFLNTGQSRESGERFSASQKIEFKGKRINLICTILLLIVVFSEPEVKAQNWLIDTSIIPVTSELWWGYTSNDSAMRAMRAVVDVVMLDIGLLNRKPGPDPNAQMEYFKRKWFHVLPYAVYDSSTMYNYVSYYTDARYSVWETGGQHGDTSYLQHDPNVMTEKTEGGTTFIRLNRNEVCGEKTLMWGPYYSQYVYETNNDRSVVPSYYTAAFKMKLEKNQNPPVCRDASVWSDDPNTPICKIEVTQSYPVTNTKPWHLGGTYVIDSAIITLKDFNPLNQFKDFFIKDYNLLNNSCQGTHKLPGHYTNTIKKNPLLEQRVYIQFKVIWFGDPNYLLSINKVTVSDEKGREIMDTLNTTARTNIYHQLDKLRKYNNIVLGYIGRDEPFSIDEYLPIKKVSEIMNDYTSSQRPLWLPLMGRWDGRWNQVNDPFGTFHLSPWKEMKKRIGNEMNIWQDAYIFDSPYCNTCMHTKPDWKSENIRIAAELDYKQVLDLSPNFGVSLQCGSISGAESPVTPNQLLYETNLALMYGAKFLNLYTYFARYDTDQCPPNAWGCNAIVDKYHGRFIYTPKYYMLRDVIKPRLNGLFGKTIKRLVPIMESLKIYPSTSDVNINYIKKIFEKGKTTNGNFVFDLGFFKDPTAGDNGIEKRFFMLLNRYYYNILPAISSNDFRVDLKDMHNYHNWKFIDYRDTSSYTLVPGSNGVAESNIINIPLGDAAFIQVSPVIKYGGSMIVNDTISGTISLNDTDLVINKGVTLVVEGTYNCYHNIIMKDGSAILSARASNSSKINMLNGHKIIVEGNVSINGAYDHELSLEFTFSPDSAIVVNPGASLTLSYSHIRDTINGYTRHITTKKQWKR